MGPRGRESSPVRPHFFHLFSPQISCRCALKSAEQLLTKTRRTRPCEGQPFLAVGKCQLCHEGVWERPSVSHVTDLPEASDLQNVIYTFILLPCVYATMTTEAREHTRGTSHHIKVSEQKNQCVKGDYGLIRCYSWRTDRHLGI